MTRGKGMPFQIVKYSTFHFFLKKCLFINRVRLVKTEKKKKSDYVNAFQRIQKSIALLSEDS